MSYPGTLAEVSIKDGANLDAFSRVRVGLPQLRLSAIFDTGKRALFWDEELTATGTSTHDANKREVALEVSASGDKVIRQTKEYFVYRAGQGQLVFATFAMDTADANVRERIGYFDASDGIFLERQGTTVKAVIRSFTSGSAVDLPVSQASWNLDTLDGSGASGLTLDLTKTQILVIDFQWLGVGRVRFGFDIGGAIVYVHEFNHANMDLVSVYMRTPKLPVRYEIEATGAPSAARTLHQICATVIREGGTNEPSVQHEARSAAVANVATAWKTVLGVRLKSADIRATIRLLRAVLYNEDTSMVEYSVIANPTYSGTPTWLDIDTDSVAEIARFSATISVDGNGDPSAGHVYPMGGFVVGASGSSEAAPAVSELGDTVPLAADIAGTSDEVWIVARGDASADVRGLLAWTEER